MLDARNVYRKVTRKIYDFSPEQMQNLSAIVWLYRGQQDRFLGLVKDYLESICSEVEAAPEKIESFEKTLAELQSRFLALVKAVEKEQTIDGEKKKALSEAVAELHEAEKLYKADRTRLANRSQRFPKTFCSSLPNKNDSQHKARQAFDPIAERLKGLIKQVDLLYKLAARVADLGSGSMEMNLSRRFMTAGCLQAGEAT